MIGGVCYPTATSIRLIAAVWCLAALVITSIYNTTLISYVSSPNWQSLVRSIFDIPKMPKLRIVVDEKIGADVIISVELTVGSGVYFKFNCEFLQKAESGIFHEFGEMLRREPALRCPHHAECLNKVKDGSHIYIQVTFNS